MNERTLARCQTAICFVKWAEIRGKCQNQTDSHIVQATANKQHD